MPNNSSGYLPSADNPSGVLGSTETNVIVRTNAASDIIDPMKIALLDRLDI